MALQSTVSIVVLLEVPGRCGNPSWPGPITYVVYEHVAHGDTSFSFILHESLVKFKVMQSHLITGPYDPFFI